MVPEDNGLDGGRRTSGQMGTETLGGDDRGGTTLERVVVWLVVLALVGAVAYGLGFV